MPTRQQSEEAFMDIYTSQYATFKENNSLLDRKLNRITKIYEGLHIDTISKTTLLAEDINLTKVRELIRSTPSKVTGSNKAKSSLGLNLGRLEETTDQMLDLILTLTKIRTDWIRDQKDYTLKDTPIKENVKWMTDRAAEWENFSSFLEYGLEKLRVISQWHELEKEERERDDHRLQLEKEERELMSQWRLETENRELILLEKEDKKHILLEKEDKEQDTTIPTVQVTTTSSDQDTNIPKIQDTTNFTYQDTTIPTAQYTTNFTDQDTNITVHYTTNFTDQDTTIPTTQDTTITTDQDTTVPPCNHALKRNKSIQRENDVTPILEREFPNFDKSIQRRNDVTPSQETTMPEPRTRAQTKNNRLQNKA